MKKTFLFIIILCALVGHIKAQVAGWKKFSVMSNANTPKSAVTGVLANVLLIMSAAPVQPTEPKINEKETNAKSKRAAKPNIIITKDPNIFVLDGISSNVKLNTIAAKFWFAGVAADTSNIQLYKAEIKDGKRLFSVIPGKTLCEKIPINFSFSLPGSEGGIVGVVLQNNLLPGEYLFIDKASLSANAEQIKCYPFTIL